MCAKLLLALITLGGTSDGAVKSQNLKSQNLIYLDMPIVMVAGVRHYLPPTRPTDQEIIVVAEGNPIKDRVRRIEVVNHRIGPAAFYPLVGQARLSSAQFRCEIDTTTGPKVVVILQDVLVMVQ